MATSDRQTTSGSKAPAPAPGLVPAPPPPAGHAVVNATREVRFAVVMYGGVSLAIYINGVAQELLRLVCATAPVARRDPRAQPLPQTGTERVYRKLSYLLADPALLERCREQALEHVDRPDGEASAGGALPELERRLDSGQAIETRFIVDILSGTSAGGINAIHLSKALANGYPARTLDKLRDLWLAEGDIGLLINDRASVAGLHLEHQAPPQSLLNSRRMYLQLLRSLDEMDGDDGGHGAGEAADSPLVDELDLFITATDIRGVPVPLRLSDRVVHEQRHRNVFQFRYVSGEIGRRDSDFGAARNPLLAFAARCTSAFPFAFEPMRLSDIDGVLQGYRHGRRPPHRRASDEGWKRFFKHPLDPRTDEPIDDYADRAFGDGGYLDNKPFSYATETLSRRHAPIPVERKLVYIEPSPERPEPVRSPADPPDALENVAAALLELPRYETIREDLERLLERNRLIDRVNRLADQIQHDVERAGALSAERPHHQSHAWQELDLAELVEHYGIYYLPYRRLRVAAVTDGLATVVARAAGFDPGSDFTAAVRCLIQVWRDEQFVDYRTGAGQKTTSRFLGDFDYGYRVRRITFLRRRIDELWALTLEPDPSGPLVERLAADGFGLQELATEQRAALRRLLLGLKRDVERNFRDLRRAGRGSRQLLTDPDAPDAFVDAVRGLGLHGRHLRYLLGDEFVAADGTARVPPGAGRDLAACLARARAMLRDPDGFGIDAGLTERLAQAADTLRAQLRAVFDDASARTGLLLDPARPLPPELGTAPDGGAAAGAAPAAAVRAVRSLLWNDYRFFEHHDQITFPILYHLDVGEAAVVDVVRISPEDATRLIDERRERESRGAHGRRKLAGTAFHNFGAFLDRSWRKNDILWGRLDGAERLIDALLPGPENEKVRDVLVEQAHTEVLREEMMPALRAEVRDALSDALVRASAGDGAKAGAEAVLARFQRESPIPARLRTILDSSLTDAELLRHMRTGYEVQRQLDPKPLLQTISRSTQVIGEMFQQLATRQGFEGKRLGWIARLGQLFWGIVEVAVPGSLLNLVGRHWLKLLVVFEVLLIGGAWLLGAQDTLRFGWTVLGLTLLAALLIAVLHDLMRLRRGWLRFALGLVLTAILLLAAAGVDAIFGFGWRRGICANLEGVRAGWGAAACPDLRTPGAPGIAGR